MSRLGNRTAHIKPATREAVLDHATLDNLARQLCAEAGRSFDAKHCKRAHWRDKAARLIAIRDKTGNPPLMTTFMRAIGWRA